MFTHLYNLSVSSFIDGKRQHVIQKIVLFIFLFSFVVQKAYAQTFPSPSSCTSKDLRLVSAALPYTKCETCITGDSIYKKLTVGINNKTGSTRTSFAFWATLTILNPNGSIASSTPISGCFGPIPKNATTSFIYGNIGYKCGQSLLLTNIWEAWTDASPGATCAVLQANTSTINPKCGIDSLLPIISGDDALYNITDATCTSLGSIQVSPIGGTAPYTVKLYDATGTTLLATSSSIAAGGSYTFSNLSAATYTFKITDANNCTPVVQTRAVGSTGSVSPPTSGGDQTVCASSPIQTLTPTATVPTGVTLTWYNQASGGSVVASPILNSVGTITYYAQASNGTCTSGRTAVTLTIKATPSAPTVTTTAASCSAAGTATITNYSAANTYTFTPGGPSAGAGGVISGMTAGTSYTVTATNGVSCTSGSSSSFSIAAQLPTPGVPTISTTAATCSAAGTATITNYSVANTYTFTPSGPSAGAGGVISGMTAGTSYTVTATNSSQCTSGASSSFSINAQLPTPALPTVSTTAATCSAAGTATITNYSVANTYTFTPSGPSVGAGGAISGTTAGTSYTVTATNSSQCTSGASSSFSISAQLPTPSKPDVNVIAQPTCNTSTGTAVITSPTTGLKFSLDDGSYGDYPSGGYSGLSSGPHTLKAKNSDGCISDAATFNIDQVTPPPSVLSVCLTQPTLCASSGSVTITASGGNNLQYSIDNGTTWQAENIFNNLRSGSVTGILVKDLDNGCVSLSAGCEELNCGSVASRQIQITKTGTIESPVTDTKSNSSALPFTGDDIKVSAYPNPFNKSINFRFVSPLSGKARIELFDITGKRIAVVFEGMVKAGASTTVSFNAASGTNQTLIYKLSVDGKMVRGKVQQLQ
ncbi:MAG: hypothetical protein HYX40_00595 [Sphingobacteriales bacterium]|nr:hypothetical protein [Sphingobacteriales bacterium]